MIAVIAATPLARNLAKILTGLPRQDRRKRLVTWAAMAVNVLMLFVCTASLVGSTYNPFLYFRF